MGQLWQERIEKQNAKRKYYSYLATALRLMIAPHQSIRQIFFQSIWLRSQWMIEQAKIVELRAVGLDYDNPFYSVTETAQTWNMGVPILEYVFNVSYREAIRREKIKE